MSKQIVPFSKEHEKIVDNALAELSKLAEVFDRCDQCGLTPNDLKADWLYLIEQLTAVKQNFFTPGGYVPSNK